MGRAGGNNPPCGVRPQEAAWAYHFLQSLTTPCLPHFFIPPPPACPRCPHRLLAVRRHHPAAQQPLPQRPVRGPVQLLGVEPGVVWGVGQGGHGDTERQRGTHTYGMHTLYEVVGSDLRHLCVTQVCDAVRDAGSGSGWAGWLPPLTPFPPCQHLRHPPPHTHTHRPRPHRPLPPPHQDVHLCGRSYTYTRGGAARGGGAGRGPPAASSTRPRPSAAQLSEQSEPQKPVRHMQVGGGGVAMAGVVRRVRPRCTRVPQRISCSSGKLGKSNPLSAPRLVHAPRSHTQPPSTHAPRPLQPLRQVSGCSASRAADCTK